MVTLVPAPGALTQLGVLAVLVVAAATSGLSAPSATTASAAPADAAPLRLTHIATVHEQVGMLEALGNDYHVTYPVRVSRSGSQLTHHLSRTYDVISSLPAHAGDVTPERQRRSRRSMGRRRRTRGGREQRRRSSATHYRLQLGPQRSDEVTLDLLPNSKLLAPGFVIERRWHADLPGRLKRPSRHCLLQGRVRDRAGSRVSLSTCQGLSGYIHTGEHQYIVEPLKGAPPADGRPRPHVIYKRRALAPQRQKQTANETSTATEAQQRACSTNDASLRRGWSVEERRWARAARTAARARRRRRSVSAERNVETLIVAGPDVVEFYPDDNLETYLLTVMNGVSQLYHDASIGNAINVILVRIVIMESAAEISPNFNISQDGDSSLKSFCNWQITMNPSSESHPNHHDVAVLLTRRNICGENETCNTLGLAEVAGMCQPSRSCNINQDTGLSVSYTIAHELGHNFGMDHDGPGNGCDQPDGRRQHVMAPNLISDVTPVVWSRCSRREITNFLDRDWGHCLDDQPADHEFSYPEVPPGALYDANHQCKLLYGPAASHCQMGNVCETLWCSVGGRCVTKLQPSAEGTRCSIGDEGDGTIGTVGSETDGDPGAPGGTNTSMWCSAGECVEMRSRPGAIDGGWGSWGDWGPCSRTCGTGVQSSERHCDRPVPAYGGKYCVGERRRYRTCAKLDCPEDTVTFRAQQCAEFDSVPYQGENYTWTPVHDQAEPCQLTCRAAAHHFTAVLSDTVTDGTPCHLDSEDICINGMCRRMGCDGVLGSEARADRCGMCHGSGSLCHTVRSTFLREHGDGYVVVVGIPVGARSIKMEEDASAENGSFLAVTSVEEDIGFLNDKWFIQWSGEYRAAGSVLYYFRNGHNETLFIPGPLKEPIILKVLLQNSGTSVRYEYTVPGHEGTESAQVFNWQYQPWSECSVECGGGEQTSSAACIEDEAGRVEDIYCSGDRPEKRSRPCHMKECPPRWWVGPWQPCFAHCGQPGRRKRMVICVRPSGTDSMYALGECDALSRPPAEELCELPPEDCRAVWQVGPWNQSSCAAGPCQLRHREVWCPTQPDTGAHQASGVRTRCAPERRPHRVLTCDLPLCRLSRTGQQQQHVTTRRMKARRRRPHASTRDSGVFTVVESGADAAAGHQLLVSRGEQAVQLDQQLKQLAKIADRHTPQGNYSWQLGSWGKCSVGCGEGHTERTVLCVESGTGASVELSRCPQPVPDTAVTCTQPCLDWVTHDWSPCSALCGDGVVTRQVSCPEVSRCDLERRPLDTLPCRQPPCAQWQTGKWKTCSTTCGSGYSMRSARCVDLETGAPATGCPAKRPVTKKACHLPACPAKPANGEGDNCVDVIKPSLCKNMISMCSSPRFQFRCCHTCAKHA